MGEVGEVGEKGWRYSGLLRVAGDTGWGVGTPSPPPLPGPPLQWGAFLPTIPRRYQPLSDVSTSSPPAPSQLHAFLPPPPLPSLLPRLRAFPPLSLPPHPPSSPCLTSSGVRLKRSMALTFAACDSSQTATL